MHQLLKSLLMIGAATVAVTAKPLFFPQQLSQSLREQQINQLRSASLTRSPESKRSISTVSTGRGTGSLRVVVTGLVSSVYIFDEFGAEYGYSSLAADTVLFTGLYAGKYTLNTGYASPGTKTVWLGNTTDTLKATFVTVANGQTVDAGVLNGAIAQGSNIRVTGTIRIALRSDTQSISTASFYLYATRADSALNKIFGSGYVSGDSITLNIPNIIKGKPYYALIQFQNIKGTNLQPIWLGGESIFSTPKPVIFSSDSYTAHLVTAPGATITCSVLNSDKTPVTSSSLSLVEKKTGCPITNSYSVSGDNGPTTLSGIPRGDYYLSSNYPACYYPGVFEVKNATTIAIHDTSTQSLANFYLPPNANVGPSSGTLKGKITSSASNTENVDIEITAQGDSYGYGTTGKYIGKEYSLSPYANVPLTVSARPKDLYLTQSWYSSKGTVLSQLIADRFSLDSGEVKSGVDLEIKEAGSIAATISGSLPESGFIGFPVIIKGEQGFFSATGVSFQTPGFRVSNLPAGKYTIQGVPFLDYNGTTVIPQKTLPVISVDQPVAVSCNATTLITAKTKTQGSGTIRGTISNPALLTYIYAINQDSTMASISYNLSEITKLINGSGAGTNSSPLEKVLNSRYPVTGFSTITPPKSAYIGTTGLAKGTYRILILAYNPYSLTALGQPTFLCKWYGESSFHELNIGGLGLKMDYPATATPITLAEDNTLRDNIDFGTVTPIATSLIVKSGFAIRAIQPTASGLNLSFSQAIPHGSTADLFSLNGRRIVSMSLPPTASVSIHAALAAGAYVVRITTPNGILVKPVNLVR